MHHTVNNHWVLWEWHWSRSVTYCIVNLLTASFSVVSLSYFPSLVFISLWSSFPQWNATTPKRTAGTRCPPWEPGGSTWVVLFTRTWFTLSEEEMTPQSWAAPSGTTPGPTSGLLWWPWRLDGAGWARAHRWLDELHFICKRKWNQKSLYPVSKVKIYVCVYRWDWLWWMDSWWRLEVSMGQRIWKQ